MCKCGAHVPSFCFDDGLKGVWCPHKISFFLPSFLRALSIRPDSLSICLFRDHVVPDCPAENHHHKKVANSWVTQVSCQLLGARTLQHEQDQTIGGQVNMKYNKLIQMTQGDLKSYQKKRGIPAALLAQGSTQFPLCLGPSSAPDPYNYGAALLEY